MGLHADVAQGVRMNLPQGQRSLTYAPSGPSWAITLPVGRTGGVCLLKSWVQLMNASNNFLAHGIHGEVGMLQERQVSHAGHIGSFGGYACLLTLNHASCLCVSDDAHCMSEHVWQILSMRCYPISSDDVLVFTTND